MAKKGSSITETTKDQLTKLIEQDRKRGSAYRDRRNKRGEIRVSVWVPKNRADELKRIARAMCLEKPSARTPGWSFLKVKPNEHWLQIILKSIGASWQNKTKKHPSTWRVRSDLVKELNLESRVIAKEEAGLKKKVKR